jgi:NAD(P)-dependent dehydrogenase (short-subunit alcohol dehydrogenase family)
VLVTGATGALGSAATLELLAEGARVAAMYRSKEPWQALEREAEKHGERLLGLRADLTRPEEVSRAIEAVVGRWGRLDHLVAVAGGFAGGKSYESDERTWNHMLDLNLLSLVRVLRAAVPVMVRQNYGRIVTVSSGTILRGGGSGVAAYAVAKGAVRQLTEILADELKAYDIRAHCVLPGTMDTEANRQAMPDADRSKWVKPRDVARTIRLLLSDEMSAVRSAAVPVLG